MSKRFCPKCGVDIESGTFCENCSTTTKTYEDILVQVSEFKRTFYKGSWHNFEDLEDLIKKRVRDIVGKRVPIEITPFEFVFKKKEKVNLEVTATIDEQQINIPVRLSYRQCDYGAQEKSEYFEGILQIRNPNDDVVEFIETEMGKVVSKGVFIAKRVDVKNGVDLYITNKNFMRLLAQKTHNRFGGILKINSQLFSHNHLTSKDIFRVNIYLELPIFVPGDVITYIDNSKKEHIVKVKRLSKLIQCIDLLTGKSVVFEVKFVNNLEKLETYQVDVVSIQPEILVLHPETFQGEPLSNSSVLHSTYEIGDKVTVTLSSKGLLLVE